MINGAPVSICTGSIDAVPGADLVFGTESGSVGPFVGTLLNRGDGTFLPGRRLAFSDPSYIVHTAVSLDFNDDEVDDIAVATDDATTLPLRTTVFFSLNDGSGSFGEAQPLVLDAGGFPQALAAADFTGDARADLVVADSSNMNSNGQITLLRAVGAGVFEPDMPIALGSSPSRLLAEDIDGDGIRDLVALDRGIAVHILFGLGNGTFSAPQSVGAASQPTAVGILRNSGRVLDDLVLGTGAGTFQVLRQVAAREFTALAPVELEEAVVELTTADFDANGSDDVVFAGAMSGALSLWYGNPAPPLIFGETIAIGKIANALVADDLNGDAKTDLALTSSTSDQLFVLLNGMDAPATPTRTFTPTRTARPTTTSRPTFTGTLTPSVTPTPTPSAPPSSTPTRTASATVTPTPAGPGDANCDGRLDLLDFPALFERLFNLGCAKADANEDGKVSSADVTRLVQLLATQSGQEGNQP